MLYKFMSLTLDAVVVVACISVWGLIIAGLYFLCRYFMV